MTDPEILRKLTERNKIATFAMTTLGCDERQAEVLVAACGDRFVWDGTLRFKGASGDVPADDPQCVGFFQREYSFLIPAKQPGDNAAPDVPADVMEKALAGNLTAVGQVSRIRGDADKAATEKFLEGERAKTTSSDDKEFAAFKLWKASRSNGAGDHSTNPFSRAGWSISKQGSVYKALGETKCAALAAAVGAKIGATTWNPDHPANRE